VPPSKARSSPGDPSPCPAWVGSQLTLREHYGVLMALGELGRPCGQKQLSELIGVDPRNVVPIIDALVDRGLLVREVDPSDRRRRVLALTGPGHDMVRDLTETGAAIEARFLQALDPTDQKELHRILIALLPSAGKEAGR